MLQFPTSSEITIEVNGRTLAVAQGYKCRTTRESRFVEAFGSIEPVGTAGGRVQHIIELARVKPIGSALSDNIDFHALADFNVVIALPGRRVIFSGCQWSGIAESTALGGSVLESVTILAAKRLETQ